MAQRFDGSDYEPTRDDARLTGQLLRVCSYNGCANKMHAQGLCQMHLSRTRKGLDMDAPHWRKRTISQRLASKSRLVDSGCIEWLGASDLRGYGHMRIDGKNQKAHRVAYEIIHGEIPPGVEICHSCDNKLCINTDHLFAGSHFENMIDARDKGRMSPGEKNGMAKLTDAKVLAIYAAHLCGGFNTAQVALAHGVSQRCIRDIINQTRWARVTSSIHHGQAQGAGANIVPARNNNQPSI